MLSSKFHNHSINIEYFKINPMNPGGVGVKIANLLLGMSLNMPKMLGTKFQSHSIKIEDFKIIPINPISTKGGWIF